jgi:1-acyl-sn-glycerol-3-phosphate acyltransferase
MLSYIKVFFLIIYSIICSVFALLFSLIDRTHFLYFKLAKVFSKGILTIAGVKLQVYGLENFDHNSTFVFVSNHASQLDIPVLQFTIPNRISIVFKKELSRIPLFGWQLVLGPYIMIDRSNPDAAMKSIEKAKIKMTKGNLSPVVFPEGTRTETGEVQKFKRGAFYLAVKSGFPIVPVSISGSYSILPKGRFRINKGEIKVTFDRPIPTENVQNRKEELELMEKVRDIIIQNLERN